MSIPTAAEHYVQLKKKHSRRAAHLQQGDAFFPSVFSGVRHSLINGHSLVLHKDKAVLHPHLSLPKVVSAFHLN